MLSYASQSRWSTLLTSPSFGEYWQQLTALSCISPWQLPTACEAALREVRPHSENQPASNDQPQLPCVKVGEFWRGQSSFKVTPHVSRVLWGLCGDCFVWQLFPLPSPTVSIPRKCCSWESPCIQITVSPNVFQWNPISGKQRETGAVSCL